MPVYDYRCAECAHEYDVFHRGAELAEDIVCPSCGSKKSRRMISVPAKPAGSGRPVSGPIDPFPQGGGCCGGGACSMN